MTDQTESMRIAVIRQRYTPFGGAERFVDRALRELGADGVSITLVTRSWSNQAPYAMQICNPPYWGRLWREASFGRAACKHIDASAYDLVQSHERIACCDIYRAGDGVHRTWLEQRARVQSPLRHLATRLNVYHQYILWAEQRLFESPRLKAVICNSRMVRDDIHQRYGIPEKRLPVIYNGIDRDSFNPQLRSQYRGEIRKRYGVPNDTPLLLFVGSGYERKGLRAALEAIALTSSPTRLLVVGKDKRQAHYHELAKQLGVNEQVLFLGEQRSVKPFYGAADMLLLPTLYDPFPNVAVEAMATGVPVITSLQCGAAEIIEHGVSGFLFDALDSRGIANALTNLFSSDGHDAERMREAARHATRTLTLESMARNLVDLYRRVTDRAF